MDNRYHPYRRPLGSGPRWPQGRGRTPRRRLDLPADFRRIDNTGGAPPLRLPSETVLSVPMPSFHAPSETVPALTPMAPTPAVTPVAPPTTLPPPTTPPPQPATVQRIVVGQTPFYAFQGTNASGNQYFHPLNPATGLFSRFPHISQDGSVLHATDIDNKKIAAYDLQGGSFSSKRKQKAKAPVSVGETDAYGRTLYGRDNTQARKIKADGMGGEPLSPRTEQHMTSGAPHRLKGGSPGAVETVEFTPQLRDAANKSAAPFKSDK